MNILRITELLFTTRRQTPPFTAYGYSTKFRITLKMRIGTDTHGPGPDPIAVIAPAGGQFSHELRAGDRLADLTRATQLELAQALCRATGTRALVDDGTPEPGSWILVAADGSRGRVRTDPAADGLTVLYAVEPIAGAADLPVGPPPDRAGR